jgi:tetratricopeptide (TPR) repeat protein
VRSRGWLHWAQCSTRRVCRVFFLPKTIMAHTRKQGSDFFREGDYAKALQFFMKAHNEDTSDVLAASNGSEAALRLNRFDLAYTLASSAFLLDPRHTKTWFRIVRSLALSNQSTKAHIFVADLENISMDQRIMLHQTISEASPTCTLLHKGLFVSRVSSSQYKVISSIDIPLGACLLSESPFIPWTKVELQDDLAMAAFAQCPEEYLDRTEGLFPRTHADIPPDFALFRGLEQRVRACLPEDSSPAAAERRVIALARCKMCAFESGIHHFAALLDHSCAPSCEVCPQRPLDILKSPVHVTVDDRESQLSHRGCPSSKGPSCTSGSRTPRSLHLRAPARRMIQSRCSAGLAAISYDCSACNSATDSPPP